MSHDNLEITGSILVVFNFCALNQTTESVQSAQVRAKWISARTLWTGHGVHTDWLRSMGECKLLGAPPPPPQRWGRRYNNNDQSGGTTTTDTCLPSWLNHDHHRYPRSHHCKHHHHRHKQLLPCREGLFYYLCYTTCIVNT